MAELDALDVRLLELLDSHPRIGVLELSRVAGVARATITARLERLEQQGVITGYGPNVDVVAAGYPIQALATLEIAQGRLDEIVDVLTQLPGVLEAYATTGAGDVVCRLAAESNEDLQSLLVDLGKSDVIRRSTSVVPIPHIGSTTSTPTRRGIRTLHARAPGGRTQDGSCAATGSIMKPRCSHTMRLTWPEIPCTWRCQPGTGPRT